MNESVKEKIELFVENKEFDRFTQSNMSLLIPISKIGKDSEVFNDKLGFYRIVIDFNSQAKHHNHYVSIICSPYIKFHEELSNDYYVILIEKDFFEQIYFMYDVDSKVIPKYDNIYVEICNDILKYLNMFAFESSKSMPNSNVTIGAHETLLGHWIIRSILGESVDMRAISSDYSVARAQHYIEQHYSEKITVEILARLTYISASTLSHKFKSEIGVSPIDYLLEVRLQKARNMMRRKNVSLTDVAELCGFSSLSHFSKCFADRIGMSPTEYQKHYV